MSKTRTNVLTNPDFEADAVGATSVTGWAGTNGGSIEVRDSFSGGGTPWKGAKCLKVARSGSSACAASSKIPCVPGQRVTVLGMARRGTGTSAGITIQFYKADGTTESGAWADKSDNVSVITTKWGGVGVSAIVPPEAERFHVSLIVGGTSGQVGYFDDIRAYLDSPTPGAEFDVLLDDDIATGPAPFLDYESHLGGCDWQATGGPTNGPCLLGTRGSGGNNAIMGSRMSLPAGVKTITCSAWVKRGTASNVEARIYFYDAAGGYLTSTVISANSTSTSWVEVTETLTVPSLCSFVRSSLTVNGSAGETGYYVPGRIVYNSATPATLPNGQLSGTRGTLLPGGLRLRSQDSKVYLQMKQNGADDTALMTTFGTTGTSIMRFRMNEDLVGSPATPGHKRIAIGRGNTNGTLNFTWGWDPTAGKMRFSARETGTASHKRVYTSTVRDYLNGQQVFMATAWDNANAPYMWVDSDAVQRGEVPSGLTTMPNTGFIQFGSDSGDNQPTMDVTMEEYLVYNRVLTDAEVTAARTGTPSKTGLLVHYKFNENRYTRRKGVVDHSGNFRTAMTDGRNVHAGPGGVGATERLDGVEVVWSDYPDKSFYHGNISNDTLLGIAPRVGSPFLLRVLVGNGAVVNAVRILNGKMRFDNGTDNIWRSIYLSVPNVGPISAIITGIRRVRIGARVKRTGVLCTFPGGQNATYQQPAIHGRAVGGNHSNTTGTTAATMDCYSPNFAQKDIVINDADYLDYYRDHVRTGSGDTGSTSSGSGASAIRRYAEHTGAFFNMVGHSAVTTGVSEWEHIYIRPDLTLQRPVVAHKDVAMTIPSNRTILKR